MTLLYQCPLGREQPPHPQPLKGNALKHFVAKLVKSFDRLGNAAESLDDLRYTNTCF